MRIKKVNEMSQTQSYDKTILVFDLSDDWSGLYIDGQLKTEGHSITYYDAIQELLKIGDISG